MNITEIKKLRQLKGLTQFQLAQMSGVSLPTIQNIEAEKANPSLEILNKILASLGARLEISLIQDSKDILSTFNMNLIEFRNVNLRQLVKNLNQNLNAELNEREFDLSVSLCVALLDHYPNWLKKNDLYTEVSKQVRLFQKKLDPNRLIKFRRIWLAKLGEVI